MEISKNIQIEWNLKGSIYMGKNVPATARSTKCVG